MLSSVSNAEWQAIQARAKANRAQRELPGLRSSLTTCKKWLRASPNPDEKTRLQARIRQLERAIVELEQV